VPEKRKNSIKIEIKKRINKEDKRVYIYSWNEFLDLIEIQNNENYNSLLISDITQLKQLCQKMDSEGMPPLSQSDLDPVNGKRIYQFMDIIDECKSIIKVWDKADLKGLKSSSFKGGYSFYFRAFNFGCQLCFSSYNWFKYENATPFWLYIMDKEWNYSEKIYYSLKNFDAKNSYGDDYPKYGITLKNGMDKEEIINVIVEKTKEVLYHLNDVL